MHKRTSPDSLFPVSSTRLHPINTSNSVYSDLTAISAKKKKKKEASSWEELLVNDWPKCPVILHVLHHTLRRSRAFLTAEVWVDLPGVGEASLLFSTQAGVSQRQTEEPFYSVPSWCLPPKGRRLTTVQKSYFINQTRHKVLSYTGSTETVALYIAGSTVVFTVKPVYDCVHTSREYGVNPVWSTKYVHIHFVEKDNCIV